jgi:hypothetical protein
MEVSMVPHRAILPILTAESGLTRYLEQIDLILKGAKPAEPSGTGSD